MLRFSEGHDARINGRAQAASRQSCRKNNAFSTHKYAEKAKCYILEQPINVKSIKSWYCLILFRAHIQTHLRRIQQLLHLLLTFLAPQQFQ